jgi:hypothetical protein
MRLNNNTFTDLYVPGSFNVGTLNFGVLELDLEDIIVAEIALYAVPAPVDPGADPAFVATAAGLDNPGANPWGAGADDLEPVEPDRDDYDDLDIVTASDLEAEAILNAVFTGWRLVFVDSLDDLVFVPNTDALFIARFFQVQLDGGTWVPLADGMVLATLTAGADHTLAFRASDLLPFDMELEVLEFTLSLVLVP